MRCTVTEEDVTVHGKVKQITLEGNLILIIRMHKFVLRRTCGASRAWRTGSGQTVRRNALVSWPWSRQANGQVLEVCRLFLK